MCPGYICQLLLGVRISLLGVFPVSGLLFHGLVSPSSLTPLARGNMDLTLDMLGRGVVFGLGDISLTGVVPLMLNLPGKTSHELAN